VQELAAQGRTLLFAAYTNAALDNVLLKLISAGFTDVLRLGRVDATHRSLLPFTLSRAAGPKPSVLAIRAKVRSTTVVGVTCLQAARSPLLRCRLFDVCILDEATQVTLPASLPPLLRARTFVLVGDPCQLPPLVKSKEALVRDLFSWPCLQVPDLSSAIAVSLSFCLISLAAASLHLEPA
jgi:DNA replication ATP-dependent helicase Dna2